MIKLPPSFLGTLIATILATGYVVVLDESKLHLWTALTRWVIMGGASLVLITYSVSWFFLERTTDSPNVQLGEYWIKITAQTLLALALAALGVDLAMFLGLFAGFIAVSFGWTSLSFRTTRMVIGHEAANFLLCIAYSLLAYRLYRIALDFEHSFAAISADPVSYRVRVTELRGQLNDPLMLLSLTVGAIIANLAALLARSPWITIRSEGETKTAGGN